MRRAVSRWVIWLSRLILLFVALQLTGAIGVIPQSAPPKAAAGEAARTDEGWFEFGWPKSSKPDPAVWVIEDADSRVYLFGTVHVLQPGTPWQSETFLTALNNSDVVWLETRFDDETPAEQARLQRLGMQPKQPLTTRLSPEHRARLVQVAEDMGIPIEALEQTDPWLASLVIGGNGPAFGGYRPDYGVESALERAARLRSLPIREMEETEPHMRFLSDLPPKVQEAMLVDTLYSDSGLGSLNRIVATWIKGDTQCIEASTRQMKTESPEVYEVLIERRNADWANKIEQMLKGSESHLVAVGAAHFAGPDSVQAKLALRGIRARRL